MTTPFTPTPQPWRSDAACRGKPPALFVPAVSHPEWDAARRICATCPATGPAGPCVAEGFELGDTVSMRGGLAPAAREPLRRAWLRRRGAA